MKKIILFLPFTFSLLGSTKAQSVGPSTLNASGGSGSIGTSTFEWSVGEMTMVSTLTGGGTTLTQGVLQPFDVSREGISNTDLQKLLFVYPNPASTNVNIKYTAAGNGSLTYKMMDVTGRTLSKETYNTSGTTLSVQIDISGFADAVYVLEVNITSDKGASKTSYKIEKLN